jgi:membrane-associated phospholipid phosphatase
LTGALTGLGLLLVHPLGHGPLGRWEHRVEHWVVGERTPWRSRVLTPGTWFGSTEVIVGLAVIIGAIFLWRRWFRDFGMIALALPLEAVVFGATQYLVARPRPDIPKLEQVAPTNSFPSGHTAAAIALYLSLAVIASDRARHGAIRVAAWIWAVLAPVWCVVSRLYRGAHHPTDIAASVLLGLASVAIGMWIVRSAVAADRRRRERTAAAPVDARVASQEVLA